jgi:hypothetical protein
MNEATKNLLRRYNISEDELDKILYSTAKLVLYEKGIQLELYEVIFGNEYKKIEILNNRSNKLETYLISGKKEILDFRRYLILTMGIINMNRNIIEEIYEYAKSNNAIGLKSIAERLNNVKKELQTEEENEIEMDLMNRIKKNNKYFNVDYDARYCPACQERPCRCSDPDPN